MEFKRSIVGTAIFAILALVHLSSLRQIFRILINNDMIDWWDLSAELFQTLTLFMYIAMIFVPLKARPHRLAVAVIFFLSFTLNATAFMILYNYLETIDLMFLTLVIVDVLVIVAFCLRPTHVLGKLTPFYALPGEDEQEERGP